MFVAPWAKLISEKATSVLPGSEGVEIRSLIVGWDVIVIALL